MSLAHTHTRTPANEMKGRERSAEKFPAWENINAFTSQMINVRMYVCATKLM